MTKENKTTSFWSCSVVSFNWQADNWCEGSYSLSWGVETDTLSSPGPGWRQSRLISLWMEDFLCLLHRSCVNSGAAQLHVFLRRPSYIWWLCLCIRQKVVPLPGVGGTHPMAFTPHPTPGYCAVCQALRLCLALQLVLLSPCSSPRVCCFHQHVGSAVCMPVVPGRLCAMIFLFPSVPWDCYLHLSRRSPTCLEEFHTTSSPL